MVKLLTREAARQLKADPETADTPIIALTAFAMRNDEKRAREAARDGHLWRPCHAHGIRPAGRRLCPPR